VLQHLDLSGGQPGAHNGGSMDRVIVPMEPPLSGRHFWSLLLQLLPEGGQGLHNVVFVDLGALGATLVYTRPLLSKKASTICLVLVLCTLALTGPGLALGIHCLLCFFCQGGVEGDHPLAYSDN